MIRSTLEPDSPNVRVLVTPGGRVSLQHRPAEATTTYGAYTPEGTVQLPHWVRLTRRGDRFFGEHSPDGVHWQNVLSGDEPNPSSSTEIPMSEMVRIGLAVTSHDARAAKARISDLILSGTVDPLGPFDGSEDSRFQLPLASEQTKGR